MLAAGDQVSYIAVEPDKVLFSAGDKYKDHNQGYPLVMDITCGIQVKGICAGRNHAALWDFSGQVYTWGSPLHGKLGHPCSTGYFAADDIEAYPRKVLSVGDRRILMAALGDAYTILLDSEGKAVIIGLMRPLRSSQDLPASLIVPVEVRAYCLDQIDPNVRFVKIASGSRHAMAVDLVGKIYTWGQNDQGQVGCSQDSQTSPTAIHELDKYAAVDIACGCDFSVAIVELGTASEDQIYADFKYDAIDNVKNRLAQLKLNKRAAKIIYTSKASLSSHKKMQATPELLEQAVEHFIDSRDTSGFAGMRVDSQKLMLADMIAAFLKDPTTAARFGDDYSRISRVCESFGMDFEQVFYEKIMQDPTVKKEQALLSYSKGLIVEPSNPERQRPQAVPEHDGAQSLAQCAS